MSLAPLFLSVSNPAQLTHGSLPIFGPVRQSIMIGSGNVDWPLYDVFGSVKECHSCVQVIDGQYVMIDMCGETYINEHVDPLGKMEVVALNDSDRIRIGKYIIEVMIDEGHYAESMGLSHIRKLDLGELFTAENELDRLTRDVNIQTNTALEPKVEKNVLTEWLADVGQENALSVLLTEEKEDDGIASLSPMLAIPDKPVANHSATAVDLGNSIREVINVTPSEKKVNQTMDMQKETLEKHESIPSSQDTFTSSHLTNAPLSQAMDLSIETMNTQQANQFSAEVGRALKAAVEGLLALYQSQSTSPQNIDLLGRSYHPIEDNPLRMGKTYSETMRYLFSAERSPVYLSPEAAINETMDNMKNHQDATAKGIQQGLWQVLEALSPQRLEARFLSYQNEKTAANDPWEMYKKYFDELMSNRQQGLEKMFWEVFEQNYDRSMRENMKRESS